MEVTILVSDPDPPDNHFDVHGFTDRVSGHVESIRHTSEGTEITLTGVTEYDNFEGGMGISFSDRGGHTVPGASPRRARDTTDQ